MVTPTLGVDVAQQPAPLAALRIHEEDIVGRLRLDRRPRLGQRPDPGDVVETALQEQDIEAPALMQIFDQPGLEIERPGVAVGPFAQSHQRPVADGGAEGGQIGEITIVGPDARDRHGVGCDPGIAVPGGVGGSGDRRKAQQRPEREADHPAPSRSDHRNLPGASGNA